MDFDLNIKCKQTFSWCTHVSKSQKVDSIHLDVDDITQTVTIKTALPDSLLSVNYYALTTDL